MSLPAIAINPAACNTFVYNTVAASTFVIWNYCTTFNDEIVLIWRWNWNWITTMFAVLRYLLLVYSNIYMANNVSVLVPPFISSYVAWTVFDALSTLFLAICLEILLIARVLALYGNNRLLRYGLIALFVCANIARFIIVGIMIPGYQYGQNVAATPHTTCRVTGFKSTNPSSLFMTEFIPETVLFVLAVIKLMHTQRTYKVPVSQLLIVIVRDGTWAFFLVFAFLVWNIFQFELNPQNGKIPAIWNVPVLGFIGSRLILNLRSKVHRCPGTSVETFEMNNPRTDASPFTNDAVLNILL